MENDLSKRPGRGGITVNAAGDQGVIGFWPEHLDNSPNGWTGQLRNQFSEVVRIAQRHHLQNEMVRNAKLTNKQAVLAEPAIRQSVARAEQKKISEIERHVGRINDEAFRQRAALKPFEFGDAADRAMELRKEKREYLKSAPDKERAELMKKHEWREAALEQSAQISGFKMQSDFDNLREAELAAKFPDVIAGTDEAFEAAEIVALAIKTTKRAIENELVESGGAVAEPTTPTPAKAWA